MLVLAGLVYVSATAQSRPDVLVSAGYVGANIESLETPYSLGQKPGVRVGAAVDIQVFDFNIGRLSIQPGLYYSAKGARRGDSAISLGYIELPILADVDFNISRDIRAYINVGPYLAYGIHSSVKPGKDIPVLAGQESGPFKKMDGAEKSMLNPFDAGLQFGAGVEYRRIRVGAGMQLGLVDMDNMKKLGEEGDKVVNSAFFVMLGYRF